MLKSSLDTVARRSVLYSLILSQPFATYVHAYPMMQNDILLETEQLTFKEHGETVRILQGKLNKLSYYDHAIDGEYGVFTEHAIKQFQRDNFLYVTGQADLSTIQAIVIKDIEHHMTQLERLSYEINYGMYSEDVEIVQTSLQFFGYYTGNIDGIYGPLTEQALELIEHDHDLELIDNHPETILTPLYESELTKAKTKAINVVNSEENPTEKIESQPQPIEANHQTSQDIVQTARSLIGSPYIWGGTSPSGFDCSGFIQYVFKSHNKTVPRTVTDMWNFSDPIDNPSVGDLVFFETYKAGPSHMGIYIGDGKFIHAGTSSGVVTSELKANYWQTKYLGAKRVSF